MIAFSIRRFLATALALTMAGCQERAPKAGHPLPPSHLVAQCEPGRPGGRLVLASPGSPKTFNPLFALDSASDGIVRLLFASLISLDQARQEVRPGLAESW